MAVVTFTESNNLKSKILRSYTLSTTQDIWAMVETDSQGRPRRLGLELASTAAKLAQANGGQGGAWSSARAKPPTRWPPMARRRSTIAPTPAAGTKSIGPPAAVLAALMRSTPRGWCSSRPRPHGKDWAGRVAGKLGLGVEANVAALEWADGKAQVTIPAFSGALSVSSTFTTDGAQTGLLSVNPGSFDPKKRRRRQRRDRGSGRSRRTPRRGRGSWSARPSRAACPTWPRRR